MSSIEDLLQAVQSRALSNDGESPESLKFIFADSISAVKAEVSSGEANADEFYETVVLTFITSAVDSGYSPEDAQRFLDTLENGS